MQYHQLRNLLREWFRGQVALNVKLADLPLIVPGETSDFGTEVIWLRFSLQTGDAQVVGVGAAQKRRRRLGRCFVEIFGPMGEGDGVVSELASEVEGIFRPAMESATSPDPLIRVGEPSTFERPEAERYCQVVSTPIQLDYFA